MEDSAYEAIYTGVYVFIFIIALTVSLLLFNGINEVADLSYEFSNKISGSETLVNVPVEQNLLLSPSEVLSYYFNYIQKDLYSTEFVNSKSGVVATKYNVTIYTKAKDQLNYTNTMLSKDLSIAEVLNAIGTDGKYILRYESVASNGVANITIQKATNAEIESFF